MLIDLVAWIERACSRFMESVDVGLCPRDDDQALRLFFEQSAFLNETHARACRDHCLNTTLRILAYIRDVRHRGDRQAYLRAFVQLYDLDIATKEALLNALPFFVEIGRWKDLIELYELIDEDMFRNEILDMFATQLREDVQDPEKASFAAKWVPTEGHGLDKTCHFTRDLARYMRLSNRELRKRYLTPLREALDIPERRMCANQWDQINYAHVPQVATDYNEHAFKSHDRERFIRHQDMSPSFQSEPVRDLTYDEFYATY